MLQMYIYLNKSQNNTDGSVANVTYDAKNYIDKIKIP